MYVYVFDYNVLIDNKAKFESIFIFSYSSIRAYKKKL